MDCTQQEQRRVCLLIHVGLLYFVTLSGRLHLSLFSANTIPKKVSFCVPRQKSFPFFVRGGSNLAHDPTHSRSTVPKVSIGAKWIAREAYSVNVGRRRARQGATSTIKFGLTEVIAGQNILPSRFDLCRNRLGCSLVPVDLSRE